MSEYFITQLRQREVRQEMRNANLEYFEPAMQFLEGDPRTFRSGYLKEIIWKFIKRYDLTVEDIKRLEDVAISYLHRPMSREFKYMCQTMCRIASDEFWRKLKPKLHSDNPFVQVNAFCLYAYSDGIYEGEKQRLEMNRIKRDLRWRQIKRLGSGTIIDYREIFSPQKLLDILRDNENWVDGLIAEKAKPRNAQIVSSPQFDPQFQLLDYSFLIPEIILPKLREVLMTGFCSIYTYQIWEYTIWVISKIGDQRGVPILIEFLEDKIDYKFDGPVKGGIENRALIVLDILGTGEALKAIEERR